MEELQAELREAQSKMEAEDSRHQEEVRTLKQETYILFQQRDTLQNQVSARAQSNGDST